MLSVNFSMDSGCGCTVMEVLVDCPCSDLGMFGWGVVVAGCPPLCQSILQVVRRSVAVVS